MLVGGGYPGGAQKASAVTFQKSNTTIPVRQQIPVIHYFHWELPHRRYLFLYALFMPKESKETLVFDTILPVSHSMEVLQEIK